jgi:hypothetical protein
MIPLANPTPSRLDRQKDLEIVTDGDTPGTAHGMPELKMTKKLYSYCLLT